MRYYDPTREMEISERTVRAMDREQEHPVIELHRRVIGARNLARRRLAEDLLGRIAATLAAA